MEVNWGYSAKKVKRLYFFLFSCSFLSANTISFLTLTTIPDVLVFHCIYFLFLSYFHALQLADTADQDADKSRTYDYARLEYPQQHMILYIGKSLV